MIMSGTSGQGCVRYDSSTTCRSQRVLPLLCLYQSQLWRGLRTVLGLTGSVARSPCILSSRHLSELYQVCMCQRSPEAHGAPSSAWHTQLQWHG